MNDTRKTIITTDKGDNKVIIKIGPTETPNLDQYIAELNQEGRNISKVHDSKGAPAT